MITFRDSDSINDFDVNPKKVITNRKQYIRSINALVALRKAQKMSQGAVGKLLGTTQSTVKRWEAGTQRLMVEDALSLAIVYNVPVTTLITAYLTIKE